MNYKIGMLFILTLILFSCNQDVKFDSQKWKNAGGINITLDIRKNMMNDLVESKILIDKTESEIIELVGSPTTLHGEEVDRIKYYAVEEVYSWGDIDPEKMTFLKIKFNEKGKSTSIKFFSTK